MKKVWILGTGVAVAAAFLGCSSNKSSGNGGGGSNASACINSNLTQTLMDAGATTTQADTCATCIENTCSAQIEALGTGCSAFIACACPNGTYSATLGNSAACQGDMDAGTCNTQGQAYGSCLETAATGTCLTACSGGSTDAGNNMPSTDAASGG